MRLAFDPGTSRLRLDTAAFQELVAYASEPARAPSSTRRTLHRAGAVTEAGAHPCLRPGLAAVTDHVCRLHLTVVGTDGPAEVAYGWVSREAATLLLPASGEWCEMVTVAPAFVPASIVRVTGLGPRYTPVGGALRASAETVDHLFADDPAGRQAAAMRLVPDDSTSERAVTQFGEAERLLWRAAMTWTGPDQQETGRAVAVADTSAGLHVIEPDGDGAVLRPTTPSDVWRLLLLLVPTDHDLLQ